jgi:hypothetical protein
MKNRSRVIIMTAVLLIGMVLWLPLRSRRVAAQSAGLTGSYGFTVTDLSNPSATLGVITFDGAGNVTGRATVVQPDPSPNATSVVVQQGGQFTGTYTVNADGTGALTLQVGGPTPQTSSFVITDGGSGLMFVGTGGGGNGNDLHTGTARKQ